MKTDNEILIDYLDQQLSQEEIVHLESELRGNAERNRDLLYLKLAIDTVQHDAINQKVAQVRQSFRKNQIIETKAPAIVRNMHKISLRVAAVIVLFLFAASVYKYTSVNNQRFYQKQFTGYELGNSRGEEIRDAEADAYRNGQWGEVISIYQAQENKTNQQSFLAGMAEMQLKHFPEAISRFENLLNSASGEDSYVEESDYFLSLAYLMNHQGDKAIRMINKIKANPNHLYYPIVSKYSYIDLKIIELKNK